MIFSGKMKLISDLYYLSFIISQVMGNNQNSTSVDDDMEMQCALDANLVRHIGADPAAKQTLRDVINKSLTARRKETHCKETADASLLTQYYDSLTTRVRHALQSLQNVEEICDNDKLMASEYGVSHAINNNSYIMRMLEDMFEQRRAQCEKPKMPEKEVEFIESGKSKPKPESKAESTVERYHKQQLERIRYALEADVEQRMAGKTRVERAQDREEGEETGQKWKDDYEKMRTKLEMMENSSRTCKEHFEKINATLALIPTNNNDTCKTQLEEMKNATEDMFKKLATQEEANRNTTKAEFDEMTKLYNDTRDRCEVAEKRENSTWKENFGNITAKLAALITMNSNDTCKADLVAMKNETVKIFNELKKEESQNQNRTKTDFDKMTKLYNDTRARCEAETGEKDTWKIIGIVFICATGVLTLIVLILLIVAIGKSKSGCYPVA